MVNEPYNADGDGWHKDGQTFRMLFIAQICLIVPLCCCSCCGMVMGTAAAGTAEVSKHMGGSDSSDDEYSRA